MCIYSRTGSGGGGGGRRTRAQGLNAHGGTKMDSRTGRVSGAGDALVRRAKTAPVLTKYVYHASARERLDHFDSVHKKWPISAMWKCKMGETKC